MSSVSSMNHNMEIVTCVAPVNIAVIKYWGKRDEDLILPINDSISSTLSMDHMCAKTTIMASPNFESNRFWLNGKEENFNNPRLTNCLQEIKRLALTKDMLDWNIHICSENNFPTAAGLASSAAGYACLVSALAKLYKIESDVSVLARRGSGSACRSVYGGWVKWNMGTLSDGSDSIATQLQSFDHWPEMRIIVLVVNDSRKKYSSTSGMSRSVATSALLKHRTSKCVPLKIEQMQAAIKGRDFNKFAKLTMSDSNQFHAVCLDTFPPCVYMNDVSHAIVEIVHRYNEFKGQNKVAYTFDAGPNACLFLLEPDIGEVLALINEYFPTNMNSSEYMRGIPVSPQVLSKEVKAALRLQKQPLNSLRYIICTEVGEGPRFMSDHLLNETGLPLDIN